MNYKKLMALNPTKLGEMTNSQGQLIEFYEHPTRGDGAQVLCVCKELELAAYSDFFELDDMIADHKEYEPNFMDGMLFHGDMKADS